MIPVALVSGDLTVHWSTRGVSAIVYLITFGSLVGYSAFVYAMDKLPVAIVSVYPYVNAVVRGGAGVAVLSRAVRMAGNRGDGNHLRRCGGGETVFAGACRRAQRLREESLAPRAPPAMLNRVINTK